MKSPLMKRLPKELKKDFKKNLIIFLILFLTIGFVSGMFVANNSMLKAADDAFTKYNVEDGHFNLSRKADDGFISSLEEKAEVKIYEQFYKDFTETTDKTKAKDDPVTIRVFASRKEVNKASVLKGRLPEKEGEIAIDRMHADNSKIKVGDSLYLNGERFEVTGLIALSDYSTLYKNNSDTMFDALTFNIGVVTADQFSKLDAV